MSQDTEDLAARLAALEATGDKKRGAARPSPLAAILGVAGIVAVGGLAWAAPLMRALAVGDAETAEDLWDALTEGHDIISCECDPLAEMPEEDGEDEDILFAA